MRQSLLIRCIHRHQQLSMVQTWLHRKRVLSDQCIFYQDRKEIHPHSTRKYPKRGAMNMLISDCAKSEISIQCHDILRAYCINDCQSEPHYQHQNYAERKCAQKKPVVKWLLNTMGAPPETWLLALEHATCILNHVSNKSLGWQSPLQAMYGTKPDISSILIFQFWEKKYNINMWMQNSHMIS